MSERGPTFSDPDALDRHLDEVMAAPRPMSPQEIRVSALGLVVDLAGPGENAVDSDAVIKLAAKFADWITTGEIKGAST